MISKNEFKEGLMENLDDMYDQYKKSFANLDDMSPADRLLAARNNLPSFKASEPTISDEEKKKLIDDVEKATEAEKVIFTIGKAAIAIGMKAYLA